MKLLFDTHTFMWWFNERKKLSARVVSLCADRNNLLILSVVSAWEMQIKLQLGKYALSKSLREVITDEQRTNQVQLLPVTLDHIFALDQLPLHHKDPFDRLLIAQAVVENAILISHDSRMSQYSIQVIW